MSAQDPAKPDRTLAFARTFAVVAPVIYVICELMNWPVFTYHPGTGRFDWGFAAPIPDEGPAMYWFGWNLSMLIGGGVIAGLGAMAPGLARRAPLALAWLFPLACVPLYLYALRFYWFH
jgi:hypothetical protein